MKYSRRVSVLFCVSLISLSLCAQESIDWTRRPKVDSASLEGWLSTGVFGNSVTVFVLIAAAVWIAFLFSAFRMLKEQVAGRKENASSMKKAGRFSLPAPGAPRVGLDPYGTEGYHPRLKAARFSPDSPAGSSRNA